MAAKLFNDILVKGIRAGQMPARTKAARQWYRNEAMTRTQARTDRVIKASRENYFSKAVTGNLYLFKYDPKWKEKLPWYDAAPCVFPFRALDDGFIGLNIHYLDYGLRAKLMDSLYSLKSNSKYDETTKLKLSYEILKSATKVKYFEPCIHRYLYTHLESKLVKFDIVDWETLAFLPLQRFKKARAKTVWKHSAKVVL